MDCQSLSWGDDEEEYDRFRWYFIALNILQASSFLWEAAFMHSYHFLSFKVQIIQSVSEWDVWIIPTTSLTHGCDSLWTLLVPKGRTQDVVNVSETPSSSTPSRVSSVKQKCVFMTVYCRPQQQKCVSRWSQTRVSIVTSSRNDGIVTEPSPSSFCSPLQSEQSRVSVNLVFSFNSHW